VLPPNQGVQALPEYRAFLIDHDGHFHSGVPLEAPDDAAAVAAAKPLVDGHDVEVWQRDRKVAFLTRKSETIEPFDPPPTS
jgi:hypothetical protein